MGIKAHIYMWQYRLRERCVVAACLLGKKPPAPNLSRWSPNNVAFVLVGMLGDTIMCLPVLEAARGIWPEARLYAIVTPRIREMLEGVEYIDEFLIGTNDPMSIRRRDKVDETISRLNDHKFDAAVLLGGDQYGTLFYRMGVPIRVGPKECVYMPLFTHTYSIGGRNDWGPDERLGAIRALGYEASGKLPRLSVGSQARAEFGKWADGANGTGLPEGALFVVIHPFGSEPRKWWTIESVPELARRIHETTGMYCLLVGGPESREPARNLPLTAGLIPAIGERELSLGQLLAAIESAQMVISTDSAPYHMAGALNRPLIGLFPSMRPQQANRYPHTQIIFGDDESCYRHCTYDRCQARSCRQLNAISADEVFDKFKQSLAAGRRSDSPVLSQAPQ